MSLKKFLPHLVILLGFIVIALLYFNPVLSGKQIYQSDIAQYIGMAKQQNDFRASTGEETYWTNSAFGGMPTYQLGAKYPHNYIKTFDSVLRFLPRPADYLFLYFIGFYILLLSLKVDFKLAALGALAFGFSTYLIIILGVGHNSKAHAIAYMPLVLSGIILTFRRKYILGFLLTAVAMGLEVSANHYQMTYYLMLLVLILGLVYAIDAYKKRTLPHFFKSVGVLSVAVILGIGMNATSILATQEYVKESTRGKSELTINPDGSSKVVSSGLDREYITEYSYGILETFNLFIPRFMGGGNREDVGKDSEMYKFYTTIGASPVQAMQEVKNTPTYWGKQPIVEAPAYVGAVVLFLFVLALFLVKSKAKYWLVGGTILSLLLSYGKNFGFLTDIFIDYMPFYNKFRAVSSIQVLLELCIPVLAILGLSELFKTEGNPQKQLKTVLKSVAITAGIAVLFLIFKSSFDFVGGNDGYFRQAYGEYGIAFVEALKADRMSLFTSDTLRTLFFVVLAGAVVFLYTKRKLSQSLVIVALAVLIVVDLVGVDRRYVNNSNFVSAKEVDMPYQANQADLEILQDTSHFRVFDVTASGSRAAYFHNSLSGYHAAKLGRYNELFDFYISQNNMNVLNMLNTKYIIADDDKGNIFPYENEDANGNAWFIESLTKVASANDEILALNELDTDLDAITTQNIPSQSYDLESMPVIDLKEYKPNYLKYHSTNESEGFAVFSEIYYSNGWKSYIDGNEVPNYRVNYVLRGLSIPKGEHDIEFKFEPEVVVTGSRVALASSIVFALLCFSGLWFGFKRSKAEGNL